MMALALGVAGLVVAVLALAGVWRGEEEATAGYAPDAKGRPPVVVLILDEFPTDDLLRPDGRIDARRFPNFARLAAMSTWFPNAHTVYDSTFKAVPAILDARLPVRNSKPDVRSHQPSVYHLMHRLGYEIHKVESATAVCPPRLCEGARPRRPSVLDRLKGPGRPARLHKWIGEIRRRERPAFYLQHALLPHEPWIYLPSGAPNRPAGEDPVQGINTLPSFADTDLSKHNHVRHFLQVGYTDLELGRLLARLRRTGLLRRSLLAVVADHGYSYDIGVPSRRFVSDSNVDEVGPVPFFIKAPGQMRGKVDESMVRTIDVVPTIADMLGKTLWWPNDGYSVYAPASQARDELVMTTRDFKDEVRIGIDELVERRAVNRARWARLFGTSAESERAFGDPWASVYRVGPNRELLGRRLSAAGARPIRRPRPSRGAGGGSRQQRACADRQRGAARRRRARRRDPPDARDGQARGRLGRGHARARAGGERPHPRGRPQLPPRPAAVGVLLVRVPRARPAPRLQRRGAARGRGRGPHLRAARRQPRRPSVDAVTAPAYAGRVRVIALLGAVAALAPGGGSAQAAPGLPESLDIAYSYAGGIHVMRPDGSGSVRLSPSRSPSSAVYDGQPAWSPDGSRLAFVRSVERQDDEFRSRVVILDGTSEHPLTRASRHIVQSPAWSPDGRQVAFTRVRLAGEQYWTDIVVAPVDGGAERVLWRQRLFPRLSSVGEPAWSPDGARVAFTRSRLSRDYDFRSSLLIVEAAGGGRPRLLAREAGDAVWSPDGTKIAFASGRDRNGKWCTSDECGYNCELYVMNADGSEPLRLTNSRGDDSSPSWSPDGRRIVFASNRNNRDDYPGEDTELYSIGADGSCLTWLTNGAPESSGPSWRNRGAGAETAPGTCGATPRPARTEVLDSALARRLRGGAFWLGERFGRLLLTRFDHEDHGGSRGSRVISYDDCTRFRVRDCPRALDLYVTPICSRDSLLAGFNRFGTERLGYAFARSGALHVGLSLDSVTLLAGRYSITIYTQSGPGDRRRALLRAAAALRPVAARKLSLPPPALPGVVLRRVRRAEAPEEIRRSVRLVRVLDSLPRVRTLRCTPGSP